MLAQYSSTRSTWVEGKTSQKGYALPSVLFLITILSLVALSVLTLNYFRRQGAALEVARVKADYDSQSVLNRYIGSDSPVGSTFSYVFDDESEAALEVREWGLFRYAVSSGRYRKATSERVAILGGVPGEVYDNALILANNEHQLVFAGDSKVVGNVVVGISGVTTGTLRDVRTPRSIPVAGNILKTSSFQIPRLDELKIKTLLSSFEGELGSGSVGSSGGVIDLGEIPDSARSLRSKGKLRIKGLISRRLVPLSISAEGDVWVDSSAYLSGLVSIISKGKITIEPGSTLEHTLLYSREVIEFEPGATATGQFIAPKVILNQRSVAAYPSVILNTKASSESKKLETILHGGSQIEGTLIQMKDEEAMRSGSGIVIEKGATVLGSVYTENRLTLDGDVFGTVITHDFYFYEAPTQYYGWLRTGGVDRSKLPDGFLLPNIFQDRQNLRVLDWL